jgi:hypothetical protein
MEVVYSEVSVHCWRMKVSTIYQGIKQQSKFMLYLKAKSFCHHLQLFVKLRMKYSISALYIFNHHHCSDAMSTNPTSNFQALAV